jgi:hypothetical protein
MALSRIDTTNMIEDVPQSKLDNNINFRNIIINGDMSIAQRGTSFTSLGNGDTKYTLDRMQYKESGDTSSEITISQDTTVPTGQGFAKSLKIDVTTADASPGASDRVWLNTTFEGQNLQYLNKGTSSAKQLTCSFWIRSNKTGVYTVSLFDSDNTRAVSAEYSISLADTWEKKIITFPADTTGAFTNDNNLSLELQFTFSTGSDFNDGTFSTSWQSFNDGDYISSNQVNLVDNTSNELYITGVQLEAGDTASDFEFLPFDVNLQRCLRYYEKSVNYSTTPADAADNPIYGGANGWIAFNTSNIRTTPILFQYEKRTTPTIVIYSGDAANSSGNMGWFNGSSWQDAGSTIPKITAKGFYGTYSSNSAFTQFNAYLMTLNWTADSEL